MATASVTVTFDATDLADAQAKIEAWTLHDGCAVGAYLTAPIPPTPGVTDESGSVQAVPEPDAPEMAT
jgi:hypothetical protein